MGLGAAPVVDKGALQTGQNEVMMSGEIDTHGEMQAHSKSYSAFSAIMKWGAIVGFVSAMLVIVVIAS